MGLGNTIDHCRPGCHCFMVMMDDKYPLFMVQAIPNDGAKFLTFKVLSQVQSVRCLDQKPRSLLPDKCIDLTIHNYPHSTKQRQMYFKCTDVNRIDTGTRTHILD